MKSRSISLSFLLFAFCSLLWGQPANHIKFNEELPIDQALALSGKEGKILFVDCSTSWCIPCKQMEQNVLSLDSVARFFNSTFVNVRMDMDHPEGKKYAKLYQVESYPTYLLIDSHGNLLYKCVGGVSAQKFMARIRQGLDPKNRVAQYNKIYQSGKYTDDFIRKYIAFKFEINERTEGKKVAQEYFDRLTPSQRALPENWFLFGETKFDKYISGVKSSNFDYLMQHWSDFVKTNGKQVVFSKISSTYLAISEWVLRDWYFKDFARDTTDFVRYRNWIQQADIPEKQQYIAMMDICKAVCMKDSLAAGNILADNIESFSGENQKIMYSFFSLYPSSKRHPRMQEIVSKVIRSGRNDMLIDFLKKSYGDQHVDNTNNEIEKYDVPNLRKRVGTLSIIPFFHPTKPLLWYLFEDSQQHPQYYSYDLKNGKQALYDTLAISNFAKEKKISPKQVIYSPKFGKQGVEAEFMLAGKRYVYNNASDSIALAEATLFRSSTLGMSPDKKNLVQQKDNELFLKDNQTGELKQLTSADDKGFEYNLADLTWISNRVFYITRTDKRNVRSLAVLSQIVEPPVARTYKYELPGDTAVEKQQLLVCNLDAGTRLQPVEVEKWKGQKLEVKPTPDVSDKVFFIRRKRTRDQLEVCYLDVPTMTVKVVCHEEIKPYINEEMFNCQIVNRGKNILLWSDRSGWGHYYRYSLDGKFNAVTQGEWTAGKMCRVDSIGEKIYFYGYGKEKGINPNYAFLYTIDFKGRRLKLLTPENANHAVFISPGLNLIVDNCSRIDTFPRTQVRDINGKWLATLETPDISHLFEYGWKMPEQFTVKAADGVTDLYGIMWKPYNFDPKKKYPVISQVYPGPSQETVWTNFTVFDRYNNTALAQRGFIVVCMGHRGGSSFRGAAYDKFGYGNLRDYPLADDKAGLEQLAAKYPFIDLSRVGITGHSGGGMMAAAAICTYPDFYKVAVASSGNYDNSIYNRTWGETYQGIGEDGKFKVKTVQELAPNLKGHLLLATGDNDQNVHSAHTFRLVDALIRANKNFDLLVLPGQSHHYEGVYETYFQKKKRDYFSQYLLK